MDGTVHEKQGAPSFYYLRLGLSLFLLLPVLVVGLLSLGFFEELKNVSQQR